MRYAVFRAGLWGDSNYRPGSGCLFARHGISIDWHGG